MNDSVFQYDENTASKVEMMAKVGDELREQDIEWGQQDHPLLGGSYTSQSREQYAQLANAWQKVNDDRVRAGTLGWEGILLEEVFEALGEADPEAAVTELVQVAAVAMNAAMSIERNGLSGQVAA